MHMQDVSMFGGSDELRYQLQEANVYGPWAAFCNRSALITQARSGFVGSAPSPWCDWQARSVQQALGGAIAVAFLCFSFHVGGVQPPNFAWYGATLSGLQILALVFVLAMVPYIMEDYWQTLDQPPPLACKNLFYWAKTCTSSFGKSYGFTACALLVSCVQWYLFHTANKWIQKGDPDDMHPQKGGR